MKNLIARWGTKLITVGMLVALLAASHVGRIEADRELGQVPSGNTPPSRY